MITQIPLAYAKQYRTTPPALHGWRAFLHGDNTPGNMYAWGCIDLLCFLPHCVAGGCQRQVVHCKQQCCILQLGQVSSGFQGESIRWTPPSVVLPRRPGQSQSWFTTQEVTSIAHLEASHELHGKMSCIFSLQLPLLDSMTWGLWGCHGRREVEK